MDYQILFCDMDHTLLNENMKISPNDTKAIKHLLSMGKDFVICTGRGFFGVEQYIADLGLEGRKGGYAICQNGGTVYSLETRELIMERSFYIEDLKAVIEAAHYYNVDIQLYYDHGMGLMSEKLTPRIENYLSKMMNTNITLIPNVLEYKGTLTKCLLNGVNESLLKVKNAVEKEKNFRLNMFFTDAEYLEFTAMEANKGNAMVELANKLQIDRKKLVAIGDSENDKSMIEMAGLGVAVANAQNNVKEAANYITNSDNCNDAVAEVIYKFML